MFSIATGKVNSRFVANLLSKTIIPAASNMSNCRNFETLTVGVPHKFVYHVELNRPDKLNAMNNTMWCEIGKCFEELHANQDCRVVVLSGAGRIFCAGLDFSSMMEFAPRLAEQEDVARKAKILETNIKNYQRMITSLELCRKPVLAAVHSACVGGGFNLVTAADIRYCTLDAWFQAKEVDIGMAADVGLLQRLPKLMGSDSVAREICYTARKLPSSEALTLGLVSNVYDDKESMIAAVLDVAKEIASKSPVAVQVTKSSLVYSRDHTVQEGLDHIAQWNQMMLQSEDFAKATVAQISKQKDIQFSKL